MDKNIYYDTMRSMQDAGVDKDYASGWACGALGSPEREEQRATDAYKAGYEHGSAGRTDGWQAFVTTAD